LVAEANERQRLFRGLSRALGALVVRWPGPGATRHLLAARDIEEPVVLSGLRDDLGTGVDLLAKALDRAMLDLLAEVIGCAAPASICRMWSARASWSTVKPSRACRPSPAISRALVTEVSSANWRFQEAMVRA